MTVNFPNFTLVIMGLCYKSPENILPLILRVGKTTMSEPKESCERKLEASEETSPAFASCI